MCTDCGETFAKWSGKCINCGNWNTIKEYRPAKLSNKKTSKTTGRNLTQEPKKASNKASQQRISTGIAEADRVLGSGLFPGSIALFGGHPGIGKSTLALQIFLNVNKSLYFSGEESFDQVSHRAERLTTSTKNTDLDQRIFATHALEDIITTITSTKPPLVVIDSIQMIGLAETTFGSTTQIRENAEVLVKLAKSTGTAIIVIGHVTKADELAGPKVLEHMVDTVLRLEGEQNTEVRILRSPKNRFGSTLEIGVFEMREQGLIELQNPSEFFLHERAEEAHGSAITVVREGARNFLLEIQVLTNKTNFGQPRRTSHGIDLSKFHLLLAVVSKFTPFGCNDFDAYLNVVGGLKIKEPAADLAIVAAILGSRIEKDIPADTVILGEVGLSGEVRSVSNLHARLQEAAKLGFKRAVIPTLRDKKNIPKDIEIIEIKSVLQLLKALFS